MHTFISTVAAAAIAASAGAALVKVEITGTVEYSQFTSGVLAPVDPGDSAVMSFLLDSESFVNSPNFPTRGYTIDKSSFALTLGGVNVALQNPYPAGQTPYFVLRNNDPAVDGFFISENVELFGGLDTNVTNVDVAWHATYGGNLLSSLNILDAVGTYSLAGISVFNWTLDVGPNSPMGMIYESMTISVVPAPAALALLAMGGIVGGRRRRE